MSVRGALPRGSSAAPPEQGRLSLTQKKEPAFPRVGLGWKAGSSRTKLLAPAVPIRPPFQRIGSAGAKSFRGEIGEDTAPRACYRIVSLSGVYQPAMIRRMRAVGA